MAVILRIFANKWAALDAEGNPAGVFPMDGLPGYYVGASIVSDGADPKVGDMINHGVRGPTRRIEFDDAEPTVVTATPHYLYGLRHGDLIAADEETAKHAGVKFVPPAEVLAKNRDAALAKAGLTPKNQASYGDKDGDK